MSEAMTTLARDGLTLCVDDRGGSGMPVVFQHGLCGDSSQTREAFPGLDRFRRITLECRGHGRSEAGDLKLLSISTFTDDVAALIECVGAGPIVAGGISMGAAICLRLAVKRPDLVRALILVRPAWITAAAPANMEPNAKVGSLIAEYSPGDARKIFTQSELAMHLSQVAPDNLESLKGFFGREPREVTAALLKQISNDGPGTTDAEVQALAVPALVIGHERDYIHPHSHAKALADLLPNSNLTAITPKATSKELYLFDLHNAITAFLEGLP
jgi:pimeloyl-ACP methyl ester carboxylesterase